MAPNLNDDDKNVKNVFNFDSTDGLDISDDVLSLLNSKIQKIVDQSNARIDKSRESQQKLFVEVMKLRALTM